MIPRPEEIGPVHFIGIGGIGMSGIAEVLHNLGYSVQGSDLRAGHRVGDLRSIGVPVAIGHDPENLGDARAVVVSSAVSEGNVEVARARAEGIPVVKRAEMLAELMRLKRNIAVAGTHGKTTTTSLAGAVLDSAGLSPTVINGGVIQGYGSNARLGDGEWMVVEADESDGSFVRLPATVAVVTNIDSEHLDHYSGLDEIEAAFEGFAANVPFYGCVICCTEDPGACRMAGRIRGRRVVTYGFDERAQVRGVDLSPDPDGTRFAVEIHPPDGDTRRVDGFRVPLPGRHNVLNALAAVAVGEEVGARHREIRAAISGFEGVGRRFTRVGSGRGIEIVDDYGHHPTEIEATLLAARQVTRGRVIAVHQPHRFTRLAHLMERFERCFDGADAVIVADVYAAGETPVAGASREMLAAGIRRHGHPKVLELSQKENLAELVLQVATAGDMVVCLGAGSISGWAHALPGALERQEGTAA